LQRGGGGEGGGRGKGGGREKGGEMTQTLYAHVNKRNLKKDLEDHENSLRTKNRSSKFSMMK
jgi:hypothetical protein